MLLMIHARTLAKIQRISTKTLPRMNFPLTMSTLKNWVSVAYLGGICTASPFLFSLIHLSWGVGIPARSLHWNKAEPPLTEVCRSSG